MAKGAHTLSSPQQGLGSHTRYCLRQLLFLAMVLDWPILTERATHWCPKPPGKGGYHLWHQRLSGRDCSMKWPSVCALESGCLVWILDPPLRVGQLLVLSDPLYPCLCNENTKKHWGIVLNRWMDKNNVVYTCNGIIASLKKEGRFAIWDSMDEPGRVFFFF